MATFDVRFLGCKVSHLDAQEVRARLLAEGHTERADGDVAVVNTCCVTHEALSKSRQAAARAARTHRRVYVTGCAANLGRDALDGLPENIVVVERRSEDTPAAVAADVGALGCVQRGREARARSCIREDPGRLQLLVQLLRDSARARRHAQPHGRRRAPGDPPARRPGSPEIVLTGINLGCFRDREAGFTLARLVRAAGATPGLARLRLSSIEINHVDRELVAALRETPTVARHLHVPLQSGDDGVLRAMGRRYTVATYLRRLEELDRLQPHGRRHRRLPDRGRARVREHAACRPRGAPDEAPRLSLFAAARHEDGRRRPGGREREARPECAPA